jgi:hypothetical protein
MRAMMLTLVISMCIQPGFCGCKERNNQQDSFL